MYDNPTYRSAHTDRPVPRELALCTATLVAVMVLMGLALWLVAGQPRSQPGQTQRDTSAETTTEELLRSLGAELGPTASHTDLEAAVHQWLGDQNRSVTLASSAYAG